jgi:hypothetical protein
MAGLARHTAIAAALVTVFATSASSCGDEPRAGGPATAPTSASTPGPPRYVFGSAMPTPTGLRLLMSGWFLDVDARTSRPVPVTGWLSRGAGPPLLVNEQRLPGEFGPPRVSREPGADLPGAPTVVRIVAPALVTLAPSADGGGLWVEEYENKTQCRLREVDLTGRDRRPARSVTCGTRPIAET